MKTFEIAGKFWKKNRTFPSLNDYLAAQGTKPADGSGMKRTYEMIACNAMRLCLKRWRPSGRITLHYEFYEPVKAHRRDHMNIFSFADKTIQDALQASGYIPDDSPKYVDGNLITHKFFYTDGTPKIVVHIEELD